MFGHRALRLKNSLELVNLHANLHIETSLDGPNINWFVVSDDGACGRSLLVFFYFSTFIDLGNNGE